MPSSIGFATKNGRVIVDYVYRVEEFACAAKEIEARTESRLKLRLRYLRVNPLSRADRYRDLYSDRTRMLIAKRFERDIDHFKYTF